MEFLSKYIGIPYVHKGRTLEGLDCWGLVKLIYKDRGFELRDLDDYEMEGHLKGKNYFNPYENDEWSKSSIARPYDVALFVNTMGVAYHAGVVTPDHRLIHTAKNTGVVIVDLSTVLRMLKLDGYYGLKAAG
jgi:cell wall-associated NlpC family hydrolase